MSVKMKCEFCRYEWDARISTIIDYPIRCRDGSIGKRYYVYCPKCLRINYCIKGVKSGLSSNRKCG